MKKSKFKSGIARGRTQQGPKKELIRKAAIEVISKEGFHHATSDKIAAEAGISVGTIYNYFDNKEAILGYIFQV